MSLISNSLAVILLTAITSASAAAVPDDLDVLWIERRPALEWVWGSAHPDVEGWPAEGESVEWVARIRNRSDVPRTVLCRWSVDGATVLSRELELPPGDSSVSLPAVWNRHRHFIRFDLDADGRVVEASESNNSLTIASDAISIGFWMEQSFYDAFFRKSRLASVGIMSPEDWLQAQVLRFNAMAATAIYPETPGGVLDRFRIEKIVVVPDNGLPASPPPGGYGGAHVSLGAAFPDSADHTVDLQWGWTWEQANWYDGVGVAGYFDHSLMHELGHARYLVDVYMWDIGTRRGDVVALQPEPPFDTAGYYHRTAVSGLMNQDYGFIDRYSAAALNRIAGHRATRGSWNAPGNFGEFLDELPAVNRVRLRTASGVPIANAGVRLYEADLFRRYDNVPDAQLTSDAEGIVSVGRNPFGASPIRDPRSLIVAADWNGSTIYGYLDALWFQLAWWRGERETAMHDLVLGPSPCARVEPPVAYQIFATLSPPATLTWTPVKGASRYVVRASAGEGEIVELGTTEFARLQVTRPGRWFWWVEARIDGCDSVRSGLSVVTITGRRRAIAR